MNKFLIGVTGLIVVVVVALLVGPGLVDWNSYKPRIASLAEQATGRRLSIDGDIALSILPTPRLSVSSLRLASVPGATAPDMMRLEALDIRIGLLALLSGAIQVEALVLIEPEIELEVLADGRRSWDFATGLASEAPAAPGDRPESGPFEPLRLDRVHIENGRLNYRDVRTGRVVRLRAIDADISAKTLEGPFRANGKLTFEGLPLSFDGKLGRLRSGQQAPLSLEVTTNGARARLIQGSVTLGDDGARVAGSLTVAGDDLERLATAALDGAGEKSDLPRWLAQPFSLEGTLDADGRALAINEMVIELGENRVSGAVKLDLDKAMRADVALSAKKIDLDKWLALETPASTVTPAPTPARGGAQVGGAATGRGPAIPAELRGSIDLAVDAITYRGGTVRNARLDATMEAGVVTISNASATLPGSSEIKVEGTLDGDGGGLAYRGGFEGSSSNARALLGWLGLSLDRLQAGRLRNFDIKGRIEGTLDEVRVTDVVVGFDSSRLTGAITVPLRRRPAFGLAVALDRINLDAYLPHGPAGGSVETRAAAWDPLAPLRLLDSFDANVSARIGTLTVNGQPIKGIRFDGQIYNGAITVKTAEVANLAGGKGVIKGSLRNLGADPALDLSFELEAPDAAKALKVAGITPPNAVAKAGAIRLTGALKGTVADLEIDAVAAAFSGRTEIHGALAWRDAAPVWDLRLEARFPKLRPVLDALGIATAKRELGAFTVKGGTKGSLLSATLDATVGAGGGTMAVAGKIDDPFGAEPTVDVTIQSQGLQPQVLAALVAEPNLSRLLQGLTRLDGKLVAKGPARAVSIALEGVRTEGFGGTARVSGVIEDPAGEFPRLDLKLDLRNLDATAIATATGVRYRPRARSVPVSFAGRLTGTLGQRIEAAGLTGQIDAVDSAGRHHPTKFSGAARAEFGGGRPKYTVELAFDDLTLDPYLAGEKRQGELRRDRRLIPGVIRAAAPTIKPPAARRIPWTRTAIDVAWLRDFDAVIVLKGGGLKAGKVRVDQPRATLALDDGMLSIRDLGGGFTEGGTVDADGTIDLRDGVSLAATVKVVNADVQRLLGWFAPIDRAAGRLNFDGSFRARGRSQSKLVSNLNGKAVISGDIRAGKPLEAGIAQLIACTGLSSKLEDVLGRAMGDRLGGIAKGLAPGTGIGVFAKYMDLATVVLANGVGDLSGDIQFDGGLIWTRNIRIVGRKGGGQALISGDVALPAYTIYGQVELTTPESIQYAQRIGRPAPYLVAEYVADLDGNDKKTRINGLINDRDFKQTSCGSSSPGGILGGRLGKMLGTALGGQKDPAQPPVSQPAGSSDLLELLRDRAQEWIGKPKN